MKATPKTIRDVNQKINLLIHNRYFAEIPCSELASILEAAGLDFSAMQGIYCGREGRDHVQVADNAYFTITWYKMPVTGQYEIVAYVN